jgi:flagellar hook protein FlgE
MSFEIALSGINAVNDQLDSISNNIANAGTYGYKSSRTNFSASYSGASATGASVGSVTQSLETSGGTLSTGRSMDAALTGRGFFVTKDISGQTQYTRVGSFSVDKDGFVTDTLGRKVQGYAAVPGSSVLGAVGDLSVPSGQIAASASTTMKYVGNLSSDWPTPTAAFDPADPQSFNSSQVSVLYDSLGAQHSVTQYFVKGAGNSVTAQYALDGVMSTTTTSLSFGTDGQLTSPTGAVSLALGTPAGAAALTVGLDYTGTTLFAGEATTSANSANGYASGTLIGTEISDGGTVLAKYSNGQKQSIGTLAIATFPDEGGLKQVSGTSWEASSKSGTPLLFAPGSGMASPLTVGAVEQSNVDITSELVDLMGAQRNYQANAKVISTENQMVQALMQAV